MTDASKYLLTEERNNIEKLTLAALAHLPTAVLYVHDLTGECGTSIPDQVQACSYILEKSSGLHISLFQYSMYVRTSVTNAWI